MFKKGNGRKKRLGEGISREVATGDSVDLLGESEEEGRLSSVLLRLQEEGAARRRLIFTLFRHPQSMRARSYSSSLSHKGKKN